MLGAAICGIIGAASDIRTNRIPNWLTYGGLGVALIVRGLFGGLHALEQGLGGTLLAGGLFIALFFLRSVGGGDAKLMTAVSAWVGLPHVMPLLIATALAGGLLAIAYVVFFHRAASTFRNIGVLLRFHLTSGARPHPELNLDNPATIHLPYGVAIAMGTIYLLISSTNLSEVLYGR